MNTKDLRDPAGWYCQVAAVSYSVFSYVLGWYLMFVAGLMANIVGALICAHGMVIAAYLIHDCSHNAVFLDAKKNARLGGFLSWICGSCYGTFLAVRYKHMRHHVDNTDPISFDARVWIKRYPLLRRVIFALEWAYIPAVEILMHGVLIVAPFLFDHEKEQRKRLLRVCFIRFSVLAVIGFTSPAALGFYILAQLLLLTVLRFMDSFQHNYEVVLTLHDPQAEFPRKGDREFEEKNTYSNFISQRWPWLNLLVLNFCYHNAHHLQPTLAWYRLPALHAKMYPEKCIQQLSFSGQLKSFHKNRLKRIYAEDYGSVEVTRAVNSGEAVGVNALSFLTAF